MADGDFETLRDTFEVRVQLSRRKLDDRSYELEGMKYREITVRMYEIKDFTQVYEVNTIQFDDEAMWKSATD